MSGDEGLSAAPVGARYASIQARLPSLDVGVYRISLHLFDSARKSGPARVKELAYLVPETLYHPTAIFGGLMREEGVEDGLCYVSRPIRAFRGANGDEGPPFGGKVFLVFVDKDSSVFTWRWCPCCPKDLTLPENHVPRFVRRVL